MEKDVFDNPNLSFETKQLHAGYDPTEHYLAKSVPIYQTATFEVGDFDRNCRLFASEEEGFSYVRYGNPTTRVLEKRMCALEGGEEAIALGSGMAAICNTFLNLAQKGDNIVSVPTLYGGNSKLLKKLLPPYGIEGRWVEDPLNLDQYRKAIDDKTKAIFIESLGNPLINIIDMQAVADIAHEHGIPLVVDSTFATPYLLRPFEWGADIVCHSLTKYIGGHGTTIGGIVVEKGGFDWYNGKFPQFEEELLECKDFPHAEKIKRTMFSWRLKEIFLTDFGAHMAPTTSFLLLQGLETLSLRMERHVANAQAIAEFLENHPCIEQVNYPSLPTSPYYQLSKKYFPRGAGAMMSIRVKGGQKAAEKVLERVKIFGFAVNVGDAKSLIAHPATATHVSATQQEREEAGVFDDTLRLSIGIEGVQDLIADLDQALRG